MTSEPGVDIVELSFTLNVLENVLNDYLQRRETITILIYKILTALLLKKICRADVFRALF